MSVSVPPSLLGGSSSAPGMGDQSFSLPWDADCMDVPCRFGDFAAGMRCRFWGMGEGNGGKGGQSLFFMMEGQREGDERGDSHPTSEVKIAVVCLEAPRGRALSHNTPLLSSPACPGAVI